MDIQAPGNLPALRSMPEILALNEVEQRRQPENLGRNLCPSDDRMQQKIVLRSKGENAPIHLERVGVISENVPADGEAKPVKAHGGGHQRDAGSPVDALCISSTFSGHEDKATTSEEIVAKVAPKMKTSPMDIATKNRDGAEYCLISLKKCVHSQWHQIGNAEGLKSDTEVASFLIHWYQNSAEDDKCRTVCSQCRGPLKMTCTTCSFTAETGFKGDKLGSQTHKRHRVSGALSVLSKRGRDRARLTKRKTSSHQDECMEGHSAEATSSIYVEAGQQIDSGSCRTDNAGALPAAGDALGRHDKLGLAYEQTTLKHFQSSFHARKNGDSPKSLAADAKPGERENPEGMEDTEAGMMDLPTGVTLVAEQRDSEDRSGERFSYDRQESDIEMDLETEEVLFANSEQAFKMEEEQTGAKSERKLTCKESFVAFHSSTSLRKHRLAHDKPYQCEQCKAAFSQSGSLSRHVRLHERETASSRVKPHTCVYCGTTFTQASSLRRHMRVRAGLKACKGRRYQVRLPKTLAEGSSTGAGKVYNCDQCWKQLSSAGNLKTHLKTHSSERPHQCQVCSAAFKLAGSLKSHMKTHTDVRPFMCELCGARAKRASDLALHMRTHSDERPFRCGQCDTPFKRSCDLLFHARTAHSAHKPFKCAQCDKAFKRPVDLAVHARKHTGERPFVCEQCGAAFAQSSNLSLHMRSHSDDKPFRCAECGAEFKLPGHLKRHAKTHGGEIACKLCGITFTSSYGLSIHMKRHKID